MTIFPSAFLWGASTAPHQIADKNVNCSDLRPHGQKDVRPTRVADPFRSKGDGPLSAGWSPTLRSRH